MSFITNRGVLFLQYSNNQYVNNFTRRPHVRVCFSAGLPPVSYSPITRHVFTETIYTSAAI